MMRLQVLIVVALALVPAGVLAADAVSREASMKALIAASVTARAGIHTAVDVDVVQWPTVMAGAESATVLAGARFGTPSRFLVTFADGRTSVVVARVNASAVRAIAARNIERDAPLTGQDVEWVDGPLAGQLVGGLPTATEIVGAHARRAIVRGEVINVSVLQPANAVRAGDPVTIVIRRGPIEVRGEGRAVNGGVIGDTVRVLRPGSRQPLQGRLVEPAVVEISK